MRIEIKSKGEKKKQKKKAKKLKQIGTSPMTNQQEKEWIKDSLLYLLNDRIDNS